MKGNRKIYLIIFTIILLAGLTLLYRVDDHDVLQANSGNDKIPLLRPETPTLKPGVLYDVTMTMNDAPYTNIFGGATGVQQDYLLRLQAGKSYHLEAKVPSLGIRVFLFSKGKLLKEMWCRYNSRCPLSVTSEKDDLVLLRIKGEPDSLNQSFTLEVTGSDSEILRGPPASSKSPLSPASIPVIKTNAAYTGTFLSSDAPVANAGKGHIQDYRFHLSKGQRVLVNVKTNDFDAGLRLLDSELNTLKVEWAERDSQNPCIEASAVKDGMFLLRIFTLDERAMNNGQFTLNVVAPAAIEKTCTSIQSLAIK